MDQENHLLPSLSMFLRLYPLLPSVPYPEEQVRMELVGVGVGVDGMRDWSLKGEEAEVVRSVIVL